MDEPKPIAVIRTAGTSFALKLLNNNKLTRLFSFQNCKDKIDSNLKYVDTDGDEWPAGLAEYGKIVENSSIEYESVRYLVNEVVEFKRIQQTQNPAGDVLPPAGTGIAGIIRRTALHLENDEKSDDDTRTHKKRRYDVLRNISSSPSGSSVQLKFDDEGKSWINLITHTQGEEKECIKHFYIPPSYMKILSLILLGNEEKQEEQAFFADSPRYRFILGTKGIGTSCCLTFICSMLLQLMGDKTTTVAALLGTHAASTSITMDTINDGGNRKDCEDAAAYGYQQKRVNQILFVRCTDKFYDFFQKTNNDGRYRSEMGKYAGSVEDLARDLDFEFAVTSVDEKREQAKHNWLLLDPQNERNPLEQSWESNVVIATSMDKDTHIAGIASTAFPRRYYLGPYSKDEYERFLKINTDNKALDVDIQLCWNMYGGIPRHYFKQEYNDTRSDLVKNNLKKLLTNSNGFDLIDKMDLLGETTSSRNERRSKDNIALKLLNMIIHMIPDKNLTTFTLKVVNPSWLHFLRTEFKNVGYARHKKAFHILYNRQNIHDVHDQLVAEAPLFDVPKFFNTHVSITRNNNFSWDVAQEISDLSTIWETAADNYADIFKYLPKDNVANPIEESINFKGKLSRFVKVFKCIDGYSSYDQIYLFNNKKNKKTAYLVNSTCLRNSNTGTLSHSLTLVTVFSAIKMLRNHYDDVKYVMAVRSINEVHGFSLNFPNEVSIIEKSKTKDEKTKVAKDVHDCFKEAFPDAANIDLQNESLAVKRMAQHLINDDFFIMLYE